MNKFNEVIEMYGNVTQTAAALGTSVQAVCFWRDGKRKVSPKVCIKIHNITNGKISCKDLRPDDWHEIWPMLVKKAA